MPKCPKPILSTSPFRRAQAKYYEACLYHIAFFVVVRATLVWATTPPRFTYLTPYDGLCSKQINCLHQDSAGFIWLGTKEGLQRYDGYTFRTFKHQPDKPHSLTANQINAIVEDASHRLWIATQNGLSVYYPPHNQFTSFRHRSGVPNSLKNNLVSTILIDKQQNIWLGTYDGLSRVVLKSQHPKDLQHISFENIPLPGTDTEHWVTSLAQDRQNADILWVGTYSGGLYQFNKRSRQFVANYRKNPTDANSLGENYVKTLYVAPDNTLYAGCWSNNGGLNIFDRDSQNFKRILFPTEHMSDNSINCITPAHDGLLWIGTESSIWLFDPRQHKTIQRIRSEADQAGSLSHREISTILQDDNQAIWVGTRHAGINYYDHKRPVFNIIEENKQDSNALYSGYTTKLLADYDHGIWVATIGGGLSYFSPENRLVKHFMGNFWLRNIYQISDSLELLHNKRLPDSRIEVLRWLVPKKQFVDRQYPTSSQARVEPINNLIDTRNDSTWSHFSDPPAGHRYPHRLLIPNTSMPATQPWSIRVIDQWRGTFEQVDDILIVGLKI